MGSGYMGARNSISFENFHKNIMEIFAGKITFLWSSFKVVRDEIINTGAYFSMNTYV
jgi:hypothetical protein